MIEWYTRDGGTVGFKVIDEQRSPAMTTNKPEVVGWMIPEGSIYKRSVVAELARRTGERPEPLIRLSDYEALQAECSKLRLEVTAYQMRLSEERGRNMVEHEKLRKDAERYRWLEPHLYVLQVCTPEGRVFEICIDGAEVPVIGSLRQAIDAAMQEPSHDNQ